MTRDAGRRRVVLIDGVDVGTPELVEVSFGWCREASAFVCTLLRLEDGRMIHMPGAIDRLVESHEHEPAGASDCARCRAQEEGTYPSE